MVKLRRAHRKLRIALCTILSSLVAVTGTAVIYLFTGTADPSVNYVPENLANTKTEVPEGLTPEQAAADEDEYCNTLSYLAYVLENQQSYSVYASSTSYPTMLSSVKSNTRTYKDYSNGVMISTDITSGSMPPLTPKSATQTCYAEVNGQLLAYRRSGSGASSSATPEDIEWSSDLTWYYRDGYYQTDESGEYILDDNGEKIYVEQYRDIYGEYSTEMTVYLLNDDTIESFSEITDNGDGTYTQSFVLNSGAGYYYQNAMKTNGGLSELPSFESISMTVSFDSSWQVLEIVVDETTIVSMSSMKNQKTICSCTTTFSYGESSVNEGNYDYYESFYKDNMASASQGGSGSASSSDIQVTDLLLDAFSTVLEDGDQFAFTLELGDSTYYGLIYLWLDMDTISNDAMNAIEARLLLSTDKNYDTQDLYIEFSDAEVKVYYSDNFAMTVNINEFSAVINDFSKWVEDFSKAISGTTDDSGSSGSSASAASAALTADEDDSSSGFDLTSLLAGLTMTENEDGTVTVSLALDDLYGISAYVAINFNVVETEDGTSYELIDAVLSDVSYNGEDINIALSITPTTESEISRDVSQTEYDLSQAAESVYALLNADLLRLDASVDGEKLYSLLTALVGSDYDEYLSVIKKLDIELTAYADIDGVLAQADLKIVQDNTALIDISVYYAYDAASKDYGTAYVSITEFMGIDCTFNVYCDIADLVTSIEQLISAIESYSGAQLAVASEEGDSGSSDDSSSLDLVSIINSVLTMDFGKLIKDEKATAASDGITLAVTLDVDYALEILGISLGGISIGDVALDYTYENNEKGEAQSGVLSLDITGFGLEAELYGADGALTKPAGSYLDLTGFVDSITNAISGESIALTATLTGLKTDTALDNYTVNLTANVVPSSSDVAVQADLTIINKTTTVLALSVCYTYDGTSESYGKVYLHITNLLGKSCAIKIYCGIDEVVDSVNELIAVINSYSASGVTVASEEGESGGSGSSTLDSILSVVSQLIGDDSETLSALVDEVTAIVNGIDLDSLISGLVNNIDDIFPSIKASGTSAEVNVNVTEVANLFSTTFGGLVNFGTLTVGYNMDTYGGDTQAVKDGGYLYIDMGSYFTAAVYGSTAGVSAPDDEEKINYLDVTEVIDSFTTAISGESIALTATLTGLKTDTALDNYTVTLTGYVVPTSSSVAVQAELTLKNKIGTALALSVYYAHDSGDTVYLTISQLLYEDCTINISCEVGEVSTAVSDLIKAINNKYVISSGDDDGDDNDGGSGSSTIDTINKYVDLLINNGDSSSVTAAISDLASIFGSASIDLDSFIINIVEGIGDIITLNTTASSVTITANADKIIACLLGSAISSVTVGDISLTYSAAAPEKITDAVKDGGYVYASAGSYLTATAYGSDTKVAAPADTSAYLDISDVIDSFTYAISGDSIALTATLTGLKTNTALDNYTVELTGYVVPTSSSVAVQAYLALINSDGTMLELSVYYAHNEDDIIYLSITKLLDKECTINISCTVGSVSTAVTNLLAEIANYTGAATASEEGGESGSGNSTLDTINSLIDELINNGDSSSVTAAISELVSIFGTASIDLDAFIANVVDNLGDIIKVNTTSGSLTIKADVDEIIECLLGDVIKSVTLGDVSLTYSTTTPETITDAAKDGGSVTATLGDYLTATAYGSDTKVAAPADTSAYLDISDVIDSFTYAISGDSIALTATLSNLKTGTALDDYTVTLTANVAPTSSDVAVDVGVEILYKNSTVLAFTAYYAYDGTITSTTGKYGTVYLKITNVLGAESANGIKLCCDISEVADSVTGLISAINNFSSSGAKASGSGSGSGDTLDEVLSVISELIGDDKEVLSGIVDAVTVLVKSINLTDLIVGIVDDLDNIFTSVSTSGTSATVQLNVNGIVTLLSTTLAGLVNFGSLTVSYSTETYDGDGSAVEDGGYLTLALAGTSGEYLTAAVYGSGTAVAEPSETYLDITYVTDMLVNAVAVAKNISAYGAAFTLGGTITGSSDCTAITVEGSGEVELAEGTNADETTYTYVKSIVLDLTLSIKDGTYSVSNDNVSVNLKVIYLRDNYSSTATDPFLYVAIDNNYISVTYDEYSEFTAQLTAALEALNISLSSSGDDDDDDGEEGESVAVDYANLISLILGILTDSDLSNAIFGAVDNLFENITITADGSGHLNLSYGDYKFVLTATESTLGLDYTDNGNDLTAMVSAFKSSTASTQIAAIKENCKSRSLEGMINEIYCGVLTFVDTVDLNAVFGSDAYSLYFLLDGDASGIFAISGVTVEATVYAGTATSDGKEYNLYQAEVNLKIKDVTASFTVIYYNSCIYIEVTEIYGIAISGNDQFKIKAEADDIYNAAKYIAEMLLSDDYTIKSSAKLSSAKLASDGDGETATQSEIETILNTIFTLEWGKLITSDSAKGNIIAVNLDSILTAFGVEDTAVGSLSIDKVYDTEKNLSGYSATLTNSNATWLEISAGVAITTVEAPTTSDYFDIADLVEDVYAAVIKAGSTIALGVELSGYSSHTVLDGYNVSAIAYVDTSSISVYKSEGEYTFEFDGIALQADFKITQDVTETVDNKEVTTEKTVLAFTVFYDYDKGSTSSYGSVYLKVTNILGKDCSIKIACSLNEVVSSVTELISAIQNFGTATAASINEEGDDGDDPTTLESIISTLEKLLNGKDTTLDTISSYLSDNSGKTSSTVNGVVTDVLAILKAVENEKFVENFVNGITDSLDDLFTGILVNGDNFSLTVDTDKFASLIASLTTFKFGELTLSYDTDKYNDNEETLDGYIELDLGDYLSAVLYGSKTTVEVPTGDSTYLDLTTVIETVNSAVSVANEIAIANGAAFSLSGTVNVNSADIKVDGSGEVKLETVTNSDSSTTTYLKTLVLDLTLSMDDGTYTADNDYVSVNLKVIYLRENYSSTAKDPFLYVVIDNNYIAVTYSEYSTFTTQLSKALTALGLTSTSDDDDDGVGDGDGSNSVATDYATLVKLILQLITDSSYSDYILDGLDNLFRNITIKADSGKLTLSYGSYAFELTATDSALGLDYSDKYGNGLKASVSAYDTDSKTVTDIINALTEEGTTYKAQNLDGMINALYCGVLSLADTVNLADVFGSDAYSLDFLLDGPNSGIEAIEEIYVAGSIYVGTAENSEGKEYNLYKADLTLKIKDVSAAFTVIYYNSSVYIEITEIYGIKIDENSTDNAEEFKIMASAADIYTAAEYIAELLLSSEYYILQSSADAQLSSAMLTSGSEGETETETESTLITVLKTILELKWDELIISDSSDANIIAVNIDALLYEFGVETTVGTLSIDKVYDTEKNLTGYSATMTRSTASDPWLSISAAAVSATETAPDSDDYFNIADLVSDVYSAVIDTQTEGSIALGVELSGYSSHTVLDGYNIYATAYVDTSSISVYAADGKFYFEFDGIALQADFEITQDTTDGESTVLAFTVFYNYDGTSGSYGSVYLKVTNIFGVTCSIKIACDIKEVASSITTLIKAIQNFGKTGTSTVSSEGNGDDPSTLDSIISTLEKLLDTSIENNTTLADISAVLSDTDETVSGVVTDVLAILEAINTSGFVDNFVTAITENLDSIFKTVTVNGSTFSLTVDTDYFVEMVADLYKDTDLYTTFGDLTLSYYNKEYGDAKYDTYDGYLELELGNYLSAVLYGSEHKVVIPGESDNYVDLENIIETLQTAVSAAESIAASGASFTLQGETEISGIEVGIEALGEIVLGTEYDTQGNASTVVKSVAVDLTLTIGDGSYTTKAGDEITLNIQVVYLRDYYISKDADNSFLYVIIDGTCLAITYSQYSEFTGRIGEIVSLIDSIINGDCSAADDGDDGDGEGGGESSSELLTVLAHVLEIIGDADTITAMNNLASTLANFTMSADDKGNIYVTYTTESENTYEITLGVISTTTESSYSLTFGKGSNDSLTAKVWAYDGETIPSITADTETNTETNTETEDNGISVASEEDEGNTEDNGEENNTSSSCTCGEDCNCGDNCTCDGETCNCTSCTATEDEPVIGVFAQSIIAEAGSSVTLTKLIYKLYGYVFNVIDNVDLAKIFGADSYSMQFVLTGDDSGISALKGVSVTANITYGSASNDQANGKTTNIYSLSATIKVSNTTVALSIVYYQDYIYVNITQIGSAKFSDLTVKASTTDLYSAVENIVNIIMDKDVLALVEALTASDCDCGDNCTCTDCKYCKCTNSGDCCTTTTSTSCTCSEECTCTENSCDCGDDCTCESCSGKSNVVAVSADGDNSEEETESTLTKVIDLLIQLLCGDIVTIAETSSGSGEYTVYADIEAILDVFGVTAEVGSLNSTVTTDDSGNVTSATATVGTYDSETNTTGTTWLSFAFSQGSLKDSAGNTLVNAYTTVNSSTGTRTDTFYTGSYIDIGFVAQLLDDAATFAKSGIQTTTVTDEETGKTTTEIEGVAYTFTGDISIPISVSIISVTIEITDIELTIGYNKENGLYVNMFGKLSGESILWYTVSTERYIGISYSSETGLITLARGLDEDGNAVSGTTIYWTMTLNWFIDNMLSSSNSPVRFLLGTSDDAWSLVISALNLSVSSGLHTAQSHYMYNTASSGSSKIDIFGDSSYLSSFVANIDGTKYSYGSNDTMISTLGLDSYTSGYYAFSLGTGLLGSTLSPLYVALTRSSEYGLGNLLAYLAIDSYVTVSVDLEYNGTNAATPDYYAEALKVAKTTPDLENGSGTAATNDYEENIFGSIYIAADGTCIYYDSTKLKDNYVTVTIYEWNSTLNAYEQSETIKLRWGSTVYLYSLISGEMVVNDNGYMEVYTTADYIDTSTGKLLEGKSDDDLPTSITVEQDTNIYSYTMGTEVHTLTLNVVDGSGEVIDTVYYSVLEGATSLPTDVYDGYTLIGGTWYTEYTDKVLSGTATLDENGVTEDMTLYGRFAQKSVTINGVVYTFTEDDSYTIIPNNEDNEYYNGGAGKSFTVSNGGYYSITAYGDDLSVYNDSTNWLVLENEIDGYAVMEIQKEVFKDTSIVNVVIPENIIYIGYSAFTDNTSLTNVVILTSTIYLANGSTATDGDITNYPFRGCSNTLNIYVSGYVGLGEDDTSEYYYAFAVNASKGTEAQTAARRAKYYVNSADNTEWLYISPEVADNAGEYTSTDIKADLIEFLYDSGYCNIYLYMATGKMLVNLPANSFTYSSDFASALAAALETAINEYTAEYCGYINAYEVTVTITGSGLSVSVSEREETEYYYAVNITNYLGEDVDKTTVYTVNYTGNVWSLTYTDLNGNQVTEMFFKSGAEITLTGGSYGYTISNVKYGDGAVTTNSDSYIITAVTSSEAAEQTNLELYWTSASAPDNSVNVTSDISFYYNEDETQVLNADTIYKVEVSNSSILNAGATQSGYYFLGWATYVNSSGEIVTESTSGATFAFITSITYNSELGDDDKAGIVFYAIWAVSSEEIKDSNVTSGSATLEDPMLGTTSTGATFYKWYKESSFTNKVSAISVDQTVVYARMQYTLYYYFSGNTSSKAWYPDGNYQTGTYYGTLINGNGVIYEGSYIYMYVSKDTKNGYEAKGYTIDIYDSYSAYLDENVTYYQQHSMYVFGTTWSFGGTYINKKYDASFESDWDYTDYTSKTDSDGNNLGEYQLKTTYYDAETYASFAASSKWSWTTDNTQLVNKTVYYVYYVGHSTTIAVNY